MSGDVTKFTPESLRDKIADRIRVSFVDLIPEDSWRLLVEEQIRHFTTGSRQWNDQGASPLQAMIRDEIKERFKTKIKEYLDSPEMQTRWFHADGTYGPGAAIEEILAGLVPQIIVAQYRSTAADIIQRIKQSMNNY
jgi:hypothetical protein